MSPILTTGAGCFPAIGGGGGGGVAFDAVASNSVAGVGGTTLTWTHTPVGTPTGVAVGIENYRAVADVSSVTYGATSLTKYATQGFDSNNVVVEIWGAANPVSGAQTVTVTFAASGTYTQAGSITVTGGNTTTVFRATNTATGTSTSPAVSVTSASGDLVVDVVGNSNTNTTQTAGGSQTKRWGTLDAGGDSAAGSTLTASGASTNMSWTLSASNPWGIAAASFQP